MKRNSLALATALLALPSVAAAQALDLSRGGPVTVTAAGGIDWNQAEQTVTAHDDARAVRGNVTVTASRLIARYRKKAGAKDAAPAPAPVAASAAPAGAPSDTSANEIYRLEAEGQVHIFTQTDQAFGDRGVYDMDAAVLVLTGEKLRLTTPQDVLTARDALEYWPQKHLAVARGNAVVTTTDARRVAADTLVAYTQDGPAPANAPKAKPGAADPLASGGKIQRVEAFGNVRLRTQTETVTGDRGVYVPDTGIARIVGHVHVTRGENQLNGAAAIVNMKTGIATLTQAPGGRVQGLVVPNEPQAGSAPGKQEKPK